MDLVTLALGALWKILLVGLVLGAGLPVLFSVGIRAMAYGAGGTAETADGGRAAPHPVGRAVGIACFAVVGLCVLLGVTYIVASGFGKVLSFEHVYPTIVSKS
ncbi:hypothetical protein GB931_15815 [Modestobacter sp. I12A-02628]|uniref:Transmembrane protein n=1 Tax=Goekera deserti TaxID=2497753 RepID=A0A7K3WH43_9ACTN|nr:hypothetical protein [Goekera deserti]MPQ99357.1 hypothetical protein [Goekera deserti]NDI50356.1 hypothetical protein [Goekera deserti]NEL55686.1 hypothetical protein [Goekera deserti]